MHPMSHAARPAPTQPPPRSGPDSHAVAACAKREVARQILQTMRDQGLTKAEMARRMGTTRRVLDRLLDAGDTGLTLSTLSSAACALDKRLDFRLVP